MVHTSQLNGMLNFPRAFRISSTWARDVDTTTAMQTLADLVANRVCRALTYDMLHKQVAWGSNTNISCRETLKICTHIRLQVHVQVTTTYVLITYVGTYVRTYFYVCICTYIAYIQMYIGAHDYLQSVLLNSVASLFTK